MPGRPDLNLRRLARRGGPAALALVLVLQAGQAGFRPRATGASSHRSRSRPGVSAVRRSGPGHSVVSRNRGRAVRARPSRLPPRLPAKLRAHPERLRLVPSFQRAAAATGVSLPLLEAVAWQESGWQNKVVSAKGAVGVGQLRPDTVAFAGSLLGRTLDPAVPDENILLSARYLAYLVARAGGNEPLALAAYAQGFASLQRDGPHPVTVQYVADVLALRNLFGP